MQDVEAPPSPSGRLPVIGHTLSFLRGPLDALERWGHGDDDVVRVRVAGRAICVVTNPAGVREVLLSDAEAYQKAEVVRERLGTLQGGSLVLLEGEAWRERRKLLRSGFGPEPVAAVGSVTTRRAIATVEPWPSDRSVRVDEAMRDLSLSVLARTLFGLDLDGGGTAIHDAADDVLARMDLQSPSTYLPEWVPTPTNRRFRAAVSTLHDRLDETIAERERTAGPPTDLLSVLIAAGVPRETVRDELIAFLFAGFDSTATALSCVLGLLGSNPRVQAELHAELDAVLDGRTPSVDDLETLPLLDAIVRESVRLYPPQYVLFREPTTTVTLQGYRVDQGTTVVVPPWVLHRDPQYWTDPGVFRPERWLSDGRPASDAEAGERGVDASEGVDRGSENGQGRPRHAYLPYGAGPRHCLGMRLARQTLRLVVAVVCQRRRLETVDALSVSAGPTLSLDGGVTVHARLRDE
jgi:cytochrome P450